MAIKVLQYYDTVYWVYLLKAGLCCFPCMYLISLCDVTNYYATCFLFKLALNISLLCLKIAPVRAETLHLYLLDMRE